jgi:hypothetical protein
MDHYAGIDVALEQSSVCVVDATGRIVREALARVLRLTLLAPEIVESTLDGRHGPERSTLERLMRPFPVAWEHQSQSL